MVSCLLCTGETRFVLDLGETPLANELPESTGGRIDRFPLRLVRCGKCGHLQIDHHVSPERLFGGDYTYLSNTSQANRDHFAAYAKQLIERFSPSFVVDIGGNDGLFASHFPKALVVDPAGSIPCAVPRWPTFFDEKVGAGIAREHGKADLITCNNCLAHNANLVPILRGVKALLADKGTFVFEVAYALPMLRGALFDLIYHEHIHHWTLTAAVPFLAAHGLDVFDAEQIPTHGGSIRIYARLPTKGARPKSETLPALLREEAIELDDAVRRFPSLVEEERDVAHRVLGQTSGTLGMLGFPAKACTLWAYWGLSGYVLDVYDDNPNKVGKRTHTGQLIRPTTEIAAQRPDHLLIASWNYADELMRRFPGNRFFIPHPFRSA
jgi:SAM-dependent methyltransferase